MTEDLARLLEALVFVAMCVVVMVITPGCAALQVQATPQGVNATYFRIGDQDLAGLQISRNETGAFSVVLARQKAEGEVMAGAVRAATGGMP